MRNLEGKMKEGGGGRKAIKEGGQGREWARKRREGGTKMERKQKLAR